MFAAIWLHDLKLNVPAVQLAVISVVYHYKFLVLLPLEADERIEVLKHYLFMMMMNIGIDVL